MKSACKRLAFAGLMLPIWAILLLPAESWEAVALYEALYCARGEMENRIKKQLSLFADRMSTETLRANQLQLYFSSAYVLVHALRRPGAGEHGMGSSSGPHHSPAPAEDCCRSAPERSS